MASYQPPPDIVLVPHPNSYQHLMVSGQEVSVHPFQLRAETDQNQLAGFARRETHTQLLALLGNNVWGRWNVTFAHPIRPRGYLINALLEQSW